MSRPESRAGEPQLPGIPWRGWYALLVLAVVYAFNIADRYVVSALIEPIKHELALSDTAIGFLTGTALAIFYTGMGIPLGLIADRVDRRKLVALSLGIWSLMTALSGMAATFWQLLLARIGVGIGEAGGTPASQSMLSDVFPRSHLVLANTVFTLGAAAGSMLGSVAGGNIAEAFGWRSAFLALGIPGVGLALIVRFTLREPARGGESASVSASPGAPGRGGAALAASADEPPRADESPSASSAKPPLGETFRFIRSQRSLLHSLAGAAVVTYWGWGLLWWTPAFFSRTHHLTTGQAGTLVGSVSGIAGAAGVIGGGLLIHFLARRDPRWQVWVVGAATLFGTVASVAVYAADSLGLATAALWLFVPVAYLNLGPIFSVTQSLVRPRMRGVTCALLLFGANVANLALAPQLIGILSDVIAARFGAGNESLRWALLVNTVTGLWAAYHFWAAGRRIRTDLQRTETLSD